MLEFLKNLLASGSLRINEHCYLWNLELVWIYIISNSLIALACYSISITLIYFVYKWQDLPFKRIFLLFVTFIVTYGTTYLMEIWTLWHPTYWLSESIKVTTAAVSLYTAFELVLLLPKVLAFSNPTQLETANRELLHQITERKRADEEALQKAHNELEIRVEERTAELRKANEQLRGEIVERQRAEEEVRFLQTMTQAINESSDFHSALRVALRNVCDFTSWEFGEAWIPSPDGTTLECSPAWYGSNQNLEKFRQLSEEFTFAPGTGLPGRVWSSRHPEWIQDVLSQPDTVFVRKQFVKEAGFKAGLGIPVINISIPNKDSYTTATSTLDKITHLLQGDVFDSSENRSNNQVLAVLVFFMFESCEEDKRLVEIVSTVATQLGLLIQRKRAEEALRQSEERFRLLVESMKDYALFMLDTDGHIVSWNTGAERIKGYRAEEILGKHFSCFYPDEDIALGKPEQELHLCKVNGQTQDEGWRVRKDGSQFWANVIITALRDSSGKLCGFSKVTRDITEHKWADEALQESEKRLQAILDNSTALIYVKNTQGQYILNNYWYETLFHFNREEFKGKTDYDLFPKEMADVYRANDQKVLEAGAALEYEEIFPQDDGLHTYLSIKFPLYDTAGVASAVCGISTDITERKRAEEALRSSVATNRAILNAIPDSIFRISRDGIFVNFKAAKNNNLFVSPNEFLGKHLYEVLPTEVAQPTMNCVERALQTRETQILESQVRVNNNLLDYEFRIAVSAENEVMAIVRDITERKRAEKDIRKALEKQKELSELKSRFVSMTSHEFRTPLTTILSSAELLEKYSNKLAEEKKLQHLHRIQAAVKQMTQLLNNVLLIGKAEAGKLDCRPVTLDLAQFCRDLVEDLQLTADNNHTIAFCNQGESTTACMDEKLLRYILSNLLSNAIKYSPQGSTVHFDLICQQEEAIFQVQDQGIGIPTADQAQLFNSFHRASNVGTISGTGLGLAIVKKSVDLHKGTIAVKSEVGVGTTFTVTLPLNKQI